MNERTPIVTDIMVDLETTHTLPDRGAIIQISAVKFNLKENYVSPDFFDKCLTIAPHRGWSEGTREWWGSQKASTYQGIMERAEPWRDVMEQFADYCYPKGHLRFWSKPSHFDFNFLQSYFNDMELVFPFHHWDANDLRSYLRGLYAPGKVPEVDIPFEGPAHNALFDTLHQLKVLLHHVHDNKPADVIKSTKLFEVDHEGNSTEVAS